MSRTAAGSARSGRAVATVALLTSLFVPEDTLAVRPRRLRAQSRSSPARPGGRSGEFGSGSVWSWSCPVLVLSQAVCPLSSEINKKLQAVSAILSPEPLERKTDRRRNRRNQRSDPNDDSDDVIIMSPGDGSDSPREIPLKIRCRTDVHKVLVLPVRSEPNRSKAALSSRTTTGQHAAGVTRIRTWSGSTVVPGLVLWRTVWGRSNQKCNTVCGGSVPVDPAQRGVGPAGRHPGSPAPSPAAAEGGAGAAGRRHRGPAGPRHRRHLR